MPSAAALVSIFGPLLEIGPRVLLVMACGLLALVAVRMSGRAIRERCTGRFIAGWALGIVGVCAARIGFASLAFYGSPAMSRGLPDPLSGAEIWRFLRACEAPIALAVGSGLVIALWLHRCREAGATAASSREARSRRIGAAGEVRVAGELKRIRASRASQCHSLGGGVVGRARSRRSCTLGDRGAGNQDPRRNDRRRTRFASLDTAHRRRCRGRQVGQSSAAEPGACPGGRWFSGRSAGADMRLRGLGRSSSVCAGDRGRGRFPRGSVMGAVDFLCRAEPARSRCGVAAARARGGEERRPPCGARGVCAPPAGGVASAAAVIAWTPGILGRLEGRLSRRDVGRDKKLPPVPGVV